MSEPWLGLHNPERHEPRGGIADCIIETANPVMARWCTRDHPCRCCMDQEARRLAAEVQALRVHIGARDIALHQCSEQAETLRAQVQKVQDLTTWLATADRKAHQAGHTTCIPTTEIVEYLRRCLTPGPDRTHADP